MKVYWRYFRAVFLGVLLSVLGLVAVSCEQISGDSMDPLLADGDVVLVSRLAYIAEEPKKGDIVAFQTNVHSTEDGGPIRFKKVAYVKDNNAYVISEDPEIGIDSRDAAVGMLSVYDIEGRVIARISPLLQARLL